MKIHGKTLDVAVIETIVIPRASGEIIFKAKPVTDFTSFDALCPRPIPATIKKNDGTSFLDVEDAAYKFQVDDWAKKRTSYMIIKSLEATEGLEWSTIEASNPDTWSGYDRELVTAGFSTLEMNKIMDAVINANGLNEKKIDEATKRFLAGPVAPPTEQ